MSSKTRSPLTSDKANIAFLWVFFSSRFTLSFFSLDVGSLLCCSPIVATLLTSATVGYLPPLCYMTVQTFMEDLSLRYSFNGSDSKAAQRRERWRNGIYKDTRANVHMNMCIWHLFWGGMKE